MPRKQGDADESAQAARPEGPEDLEAQQARPYVVYIASFRPSEVDIPDACPLCGSDFRSGALIEGNWLDTTVSSHLSSHALEGEGRSEAGETSYPTDRFETDGGPEIERDDEHAPRWFTDAHAVLLHRVRCGCLWPENKKRSDFYGGRTRMPFPTFL